MAMSSSTTGRTSGRCEARGMGVTGPEARLRAQLFAGRYPEALHLADEAHRQKRSWAARRYAGPLPPPRGPRCAAAAASAEARVGDQAQDLEHHRRADEGGVAGLIVGRRNFHDVAADQIEAAQTPQQPLGFERREAADLGRPGTGRVDRIEPVHVEGDVGRAIADDGARLLDDALDSEGGELLDEHHAHAVRARELDAIHEILAAADTDLNRALRVEYARLHGEAKRCPVSEFRAVELAPGVGVGVDVHHADGRIGGDRPEYRVGDGMIAPRAHGDDSGGLDLAVEGLDLLDLLLEVVTMREAHIPR